VFTCLAEGKSFITAQTSWNQRLASCKIRKPDNSCGTWLMADGWNSVFGAERPNSRDWAAPRLSARRKGSGVGDPH